MLAERRQLELRRERPTLPVKDLVATPERE